MRRSSRRDNPSFSTITYNAQNHFIVHRVGHLDTKPCRKVRNDRRYTNVIQTRLAIECVFLQVDPLWSCKEHIRESLCNAVLPRIINSDRVLPQFLAPYRQLDPPFPSLCHPKKAGIKPQPLKFHRQTHATTIWNWPNCRPRLLYGTSSPITDLKNATISERRATKSAN